MKTLGTIILTAILSISATYYITSKELKESYEEYISTSEKLLWEIEEFNEDNELYWGDTICEGDNWANFNDCRRSLGIGTLPYYKDVK